MMRSLMYFEWLGNIHLVEDVLRPFLPTYLTEAVVLVLVLRQHVSRRPASKLREPLPAHNLWILPLLVWSLQVALLNLLHLRDKWPRLELMDPMRMGQPMLGLFISLLALLVVITCQVAGTLISGSRPNTLGLDSRSFTAFVYILMSLVLDAFLFEVLLRWFN